MRHRLLTSLDPGSGHKLTLVTAPAGYGKTSLFATWARQAPPEAIAWLALDAGDGNATRFWLYFAEAVERARPGVGRRASALIRARGTAPGVALNELLADLASAAPLAIVLDDLHLIEDEQCLELLAFAIEHLPDGVRVIAGARRDPKLPLGRLRGLGHLGEVRATKLAFSADEAAQLLDGLGLDLGEDDVALLLERTEGWPVALYLAALWLRERDDPRAHVREFASDNRFVIEYLTEEILGALDPWTRAFLVETSVLGAFSAPLCDHVLARTDSAELLARLPRQNLLLVPLDRHEQWFRYHPLLADMLRLELEREDSTAATALHRRAVTWLREHGFLEEAVVHALAAADPDDAADILSEAWTDMLNGGEAEALIRLVERLPLEVLIVHPELASGAALGSYLARRPAYERSRWLSVVERSRIESPGTWTPHAATLSSLAHAIPIGGDIGVGCAARAPGGRDGRSGSSGRGVGARDPGLRALPRR